ncbi:hypothetical protein ACFPM0_28130 [Pseudonocardia sulfidoxydans]
MPSRSLRTSTFCRSHGVKSNASCGHTSRAGTTARRPSAVSPRP